MTKEHYLELRDKCGEFASWAIWADPDAKPKSNTGDLSIFDVDKHPEILSMVNPDIIMVGLNFSRPVEKNVKRIFGNFHDSSPIAQDYKIRHAFSGTKYYGAYMTDIIKNYVELNSVNVAEYWRKNDEFRKCNLHKFEQEVSCLQITNPLIIAFGHQAFSILDKYFRDRYRIVRVPHYSNYISKENYRCKVWTALHLFDSESN